MPVQDDAKGLLLGIVGFPVILALACGEPEPGPSGATDASTGVASTSGSSTGDESSSTSWTPPDPDGSGGPSPSQTASCLSYVSCVAELGLPDADAIEQMYGSAAECWDGDFPQAAACNDACKDGLVAVVMDLEATGQAVPEVCDPPRNVAWSEIEEILSANCVIGCHEPGGEDPSLDLSDGAYYAIYGVASDQSLLFFVEPWVHEESYLWHKLNGSQGSVGGGGGRMPKGVPALTAEQIDAVADWIDNGAQNF